MSVFKREGGKGFPFRPSMAPSPVSRPTPAPVTKVTPAPIPLAEKKPGKYSSAGVTYVGCFEDDGLNRALDGPKEVSRTGMDAEVG